MTRYWNPTGYQNPEGHRDSSVAVLRSPSKATGNPIVVLC